MSLGFKKSLIISFLSIGVLLRLLGGISNNAPDIFLERNSKSTTTLEKEINTSYSNCEYSTDYGFQNTKSSNVLLLIEETEKEESSSTKKTPNLEKDQFLNNSIWQNFILGFLKFENKFSYAANASSIGVCSPLFLLFQVFRI